MITRKFLAIFAFAWFVMIFFGLISVSEGQIRYVPIPQDDATTAQPEESGQKPQNPQPAPNTPDSESPAQPLPGGSKSSEGQPNPPANSNSESAPVTNGHELSRGLPARVMERKLGPERFKDFQQKLEELKSVGGCGRGAPCADTFFDQAAPATGDSTSVSPQGTNFFSAQYGRVTVEGSRGFVNTYGGIPGGGVVLEGAAVGLPPIQEMGYDSKFNAFVMDGREVYFSKVPPNVLAELCRAINRDDRVGVSLGQRQLVYGAVPKDSDMAFDLKLADHFLGDIVFAQNDWTRGYKLASSFSPSALAVFRAFAVFFRFNDFRFETKDEEVLLSQANLQATLVPLSDHTAPDGNLLPDDDAIRAGDVSPEFETNVRHITENIEYYRQEPIIRRTFAYGEVAAFLRALKSKGADLEELAAHIAS